MGLTPVAGLYLCGGATHPGGNVTGLCGYNAARVLATDAGKSVWWNPPDFEAALARVNAEHGWERELKWRSSRAIARCGSGSCDAPSQ